MGQIINRGIGFGIWWASDPTRLLSTVGIIWLNTLGGTPLLNAIGGWSREMTWGIVRGAAKGAWAGVAFTARTTWARLLLPLGIWAAPAAAPVAVGAGVVITATVIAGIHTGLLQKADMVGPSAPKTSDPTWFGGLEMNPYMFSMGTVV